MHDMKQEILQTANRIFRKGLAASMIASAMLLSLLPFAGSSQGVYKALKNAPIIKYIGTVEDKLVFQVDLDNVTDKQLFVSIKDDEGIILFTEKVKDLKFSKKFAFEKEEFRDRKITFEVHSTKANTAQTFEVSHNLRMVEDVVITRH